MRDRLLLKKTELISDRRKAAFDEKIKIGKKIILINKIILCRRVL